MDHMFQALCAKILKVSALLGILLFSNAAAEETSSFIPANDFEVSLIKAADFPEHIPQFYKDLRQAEFIAVTSDSSPNTSKGGATDGDKPIQLKQIEKSGKRYIPVFSSPTRIEAIFKDKTQVINMNAIELMKLTAGADLILNPGSDYGKEFLKEEIAEILRKLPQLEKAVQREGSRIMLGEPTKFPTELTAALSQYFGTLDNVEKAYVAHYFDPASNEKSHTIVAIQYSGDWEAIAARLAAIIHEVNIPDPPVDFFPINEKPKKNSGVEEYFRNKAKPFYERK